MEILDIKNTKSLDEYILLCKEEWSDVKQIENKEEYIKKSKEKILNGEKVISILGLTDNNTLLGFISLFKYDGEERKDLTPWYATMYVKKEYRSKGYSKILNDALLKHTKKLGYNKIYLKSDLVNYYEKFGAKYIENLNNGEKLFYIDLC